MLCLAGAALGALSLVIVWLSQVVDSSRFSMIYALRSFQYDPLQMVGSGLVDDVLITGVGLFIIGTLAAFVTPLAGWVQLAGVGLFFAQIVPQIGPRTSIGMGAVFGVVSTVLVMYSQFYPVGVGIPRHSKGPAGNYLTVAGRFRQSRMNALCAAGALIGLLGLVLAWATTTTITSVDALPQHQAGTAIDYLTAQKTYLGIGNLGFEVAVGVFLAGTVLAFISPAGGIAQLFGVGLYYSNISSYLVSTSGNGFGSCSTCLGTGFYVAAAAGGITLISLALVIGPGYAKPVRTWRERLLAWTLREG